MKNFRLDLEYDGTDFFGWQIQPEARSVERTLRDALSQLLNQPISLIVAGRTDTGVHAKHQVANFLAETKLPLKNMLEGSNTLLPKEIAVTGVREVPLDWNARFAATLRHYRYRILMGNVRSPFAARFTTHVKYELNVQDMITASRYLVGKHDFSAFRSVHCGANNPVRDIQEFSISQENRFVTLDIKANAFLRNMIRVIVGTLILVGRGALPPEKVKEILEGKDRTLAGPTAPPQGLTLWKVHYPEIDGEHYP